MYRYLVFAHDYYYPFGGIEDCVLMSNDYNECVIEAQTQKRSNDLVYVYDSEEKQKVLEYDRTV